VNQWIHYVKCQSLPGRIKAIFKGLTGSLKDVELIMIDPSLIKDKVYDKEEGKHLVRKLADGIQLLNQMLFSRDNYVDMNEGIDVSVSEQSIL
jgi:hypothetical protein